MPKDLVIFDADGTLTNTNHHFVSAYKEAFGQMGLAVDPERLLATIGMGHDQAIPLLTSKEWYKRNGAEVVQRAEKIFLDEYLRQSRLFPGACEIVSRLKKCGKTVALASSSQRVIVDYYLTLFPEGPNAFSAVVSYDDITHSKPHPELFLRVLTCLKMEAAQACTVGDSAWDMQASNRARVDSIGVLSGGTPEEELRQMGAKEIYPNVQDLLEHLDTSLILANGH